MADRRFPAAPVWCDWHRVQSCPNNDVADFVKVPPRSLVVGVPGKVRGEVKDRHTKLIAELCESYIKKTERYNRQGNLESAADAQP